MLMGFILRIGQLIFGAGLWIFFMKWVIDGIRNVCIKRKLFKNVIHEVFTNTTVMYFTYNENLKILSSPNLLVGTKYKYSFIAWHILVQTGFIKNIKFENITFLQQLYFRIEKLDDAIKTYYDLPHEIRVKSKTAFKSNTQELMDLYNKFIVSHKFGKWRKKYGKSFGKDILRIRSEFEGKEFPPPLLSGQAEKSQ